MVHLEFIGYGIRSPEERRELCRSNISLFVLIGNPGVVWHPQSGQCVHTKPHTLPVGYTDNGTTSKLIRSSYFSSILNEETHKELPQSSYTFRYDNKDSQNQLFAPWNRRKCVTPARTESFLSGYRMGAAHF